mmetsp:Transcript_6807/g.8855  ORF Transcript_6807/g.8855 Transcript_6807/m.8855 type:complete len:590 (+) Transcript_6807:187-1956(+)
MVGVWTLAASCIPSWYDNFQTLGPSSFRKYLCLLLVVHTLLRTYTFTNIYHVDFFDSFSPIDCLVDFTQSFPNDLVVNFDTKRSTFSFSKNEGIVNLYDNDSQDSQEELHGERENVKLPLCMRELLGLSFSYLSKSSLSANGFWYRVSPHIAFVNGNSDYRSPGIVPEDKLNLVIVGESNVYLLDMFPVKTLAVKVMRSLCSYRYNNNDYQNDFESVCSIDRQTLGVKIGRITRNLRSIFKSQQESGSDSNENQYSWASFEFDLSSKKNVILLAFALIMSSVFSFLSVVDFVDMCVTAILVGWLLRTQWVRSMLNLRPEWNPIIQQLSLNFYLGLVLHTATPILLINSVFPYPYADMYGFSPFVHLAYVFYIIKYHILPSLARTRGGRTVGNETNAGLNEITQVVRHRGTSPSDIVMARNFMVQQFRRISHLSTDEQLEWKHYIEYQDKIHELMADTEMNAALKIRTLKNQMETTTDKISVCSGIVHVWSVLNDEEMIEGSASTGIGGPGFCYGMSSAGVYILLAWYESPFSRKAQEVISRFPGTVLVSSELCPTHLLQPTKEETETLITELNRLKKLLADMEPILKST